MSSSTPQVSRSLAKSVYAVETPEGDGAIVRRSIGTMAQRHLTPFLMLDHFVGEPGGAFPDHPHRGQTTVSYLLAGKMQHEDTMGYKGMLEPGDVQWMTAGRGVMHAEMPWFDPDPKKRENVVGLQLWVDLPKDQKFIAPSYQDKKANEIDTIHPKDGVEIKVISGESHGTTGYVRPVGGCWYLDIKLQKPGTSVFHPLPEGWTAFAYVITGKLAIGEDPTPKDKYHTLILSSSDGQNGVLLTRPEDSTEEETRLILVAGEPLDQPIVQHGPFVLNTREQARQAILDFHLGQNGFEGAPGWKSSIGGR